jgi:hypothetical protein
MSVDRLAGLLAESDIKDETSRDYATRAYGVSDSMLDGLGENP